MNYFFIFFLLLSCSLKKENEKINFIISHNIRGEVEPCGCQDYPRGGLAQVSGFLKQKKNPYYFIDLGDSLFPMETIPSLFIKSYQFKAQTIDSFWREHKLYFWLPGEVDFANGVQFIKKIKSYDKIFISNLENHEKTKVISLNEKKIFLISLSKLPYYKTIEPLKYLEKFFKLNKPDYVIIFSHLGYDQDVLLAQQFPQINYIFGSHDEKFLSSPIKINNTFIAQTSSKNHYLIDFSLEQNGNIFVPKYQLVEMKTHWKNDLYENKMQNWRKDLASIQEKEQNNIGNNPHTVSTAHLALTSSCKDCHLKQYEFWQKTNHSLAYLTLMKKNAHANPECIGCHSIKYNQESGFHSSHDIVRFLNPAEKENYWKKIRTETMKIKTIKELSLNEKKQIHQFLEKNNNDFKVIENFSSVQCTHCHNIATNHPFSTQNSIPKKKVLSSTCLKCHTPDQSAQWYNNLVPNAHIIEEKIKKISCPQRLEGDI